MSHKQAKAQRLKQPWFKMVSFFDGPAKKIAEMGGEDVVLSGWVPPHNDLAVVLVPTSVTHDQGRVLEMTLKAQFGHSVLVLSNNIQLVKLQAISEHEAHRLMEEGGADVIQYSKEEDEAPGQERAEGGSLRGEDSGDAPDDLRPAGSSAGDDAGGEGEAAEGVEPAPEGEQGPKV